MKPILTVENEMTPIERVRTSSRAFERMVDYGRQRHDSGADAWSAQHINAPQQAAALVERCPEVFGSAHDRQRDRPGALRTHRAGAARDRAGSRRISCASRASRRGEGSPDALRQERAIVLIVVCVAIALYLLYLLRRPMAGS